MPTGNLTISHKVKINQLRQSLAEATAAHERLRKMVSDTILPPTEDVYSASMRSWVYQIFVDLNDGNGRCCVLQQEDTSGPVSPPPLVLTCDCRDYRITRPDMTPWCAHCEYVVANGRDVLNAANMIFPLSGAVQVVLLEEPGVTVNVVVQQATDGSQFGTLLLHLNEKKTQSIGVIGRGDNRRAFKSMVLDWLSDQVAQGQIACPSRFHLGEPIDLTPLETNFEHPALADLVDILTIGACRSCNEYALLPELDERSPMDYKRQKSRLIPSRPETT